MTWFEDLTGFPEESHSQVRGALVLSGSSLTSLVSRKTFTCGHLETPSLAELRDRLRSGDRPNGRLTLREVVANVQELHADVSNQGSLFQVASQFNLLEMVHPSLTPEDGVGIYENDRTQGPACAIAAGAGTIFRNYFAKVQDQIGQSATKQIDCLADLGTELGNDENRLWEMRNGYALASHEGLAQISTRIRNADERELDSLRQLLRIGIQWNTQVTIRECKHTITQAYCSALPVSYSTNPSDLWEDFARLVLDASYVNRPGRWFTVVRGHGLHVG